MWGRPWACHTPGMYSHVADAALVVKLELELEDTVVRRNVHSHVAPGYDLRTEAHLGRPTASIHVPNLRSTRRRKHAQRVSSRVIITPAKRRAHHHTERDRHRATTHHIA